MLKTTRRGFIGGLLFAPFAPALAKAGVLREPRSWLWSKVDVVKTIVDGYQVIARGQRSDGSWFYVRHMIPEWILDWKMEKINGTNYYSEFEHKHRCAEDLIAPFLTECRHELETFLDPKCNCVVGQWCDLHKYLKPPMAIDREPVQLATLIGNPVQGEIVTQKTARKRDVDFMLGVEMEDGIEVSVSCTPQVTGEVFLRAAADKMPMKRVRQ